MSRKRSVTIESGPMLSNMQVLGIVGTALVAMSIALRSMGRVWWCTVGDWSLIALENKSTHNSQHLFDPYSISHFLHGILFAVGLRWLFPKWHVRRVFVVAVVLEAAWEVIENTSLIINRYRTATFSFDYFGDSIANSVSDVLFCMIGFAVAWQLRRPWVFVVFALSEIVMLWWIRDSLLLNIILLIQPIPAITEWQLMG